MGCRTFFTFPDHLSQKQRFDQLRSDPAPVRNKVRIYWNRHSVPFIEAENDKDLAFAVGVVHAHLRIDQLELMRAVSQGRLSEMAGPLPQVQQIDHALRLINFKESAQRSLQIMSTESREWLENFTRGLNWTIAGLKETPTTNSLMDHDLEPYTLLEVATLSRLVAADLSWITYLKYLKYAERGDWELAFHHSLQKLQTDIASHNNAIGSDLSDILRSFSRSGSNSIVFSGKKTRSGAAMIASDPHVGLSLPNFWIMVGIKSPRYHAFGLMIPGVPIIGVGRNRDIAWGGTNMRAISTHLYDVSDLPSRDISTRTETIKRRWWFDSEAEIRETKQGPVLSDVGFFDSESLPFSVSLKWLGQEGSDEVQSFLQVARASGWEDFKSSFKNYRVSAMNMLYADKKGNIGMVGAYGQPVLKKPELTLSLVKKTDNPIVGVLAPTQHPNPFNPKEGFIASANNKPFANPAIPFSFSYANNDRMNRLKQLADPMENVTVDDLIKLQLDVFSQSAFDLKDLLLERVRSEPSVWKHAHLQKLEAWDGRYQADSEGAVVFHVLMYSLWQRYLQRYEEGSILREEVSKNANWKVLLAPWVEEQTESDLVQLVQRSLGKIDEVLTSYPNWGSFTRQSQSTLFGMIPFIGSRFRLEDYPVSGGSDTLNKYGRPFSLKRENVTYGASARHISDLSSLDENYFVLHGGQDSWMLNENLADQTKLWREGKYIKIPLSMSRVREEFTAFTAVLRPQE